MPQAVLDKESQLARVLDGIRQLYADPVGRGAEQLAGVFTDPTVEALPMMGFRVPGALGREIANRGATILERAIEHVRKQGYDVDTAFTSGVPRLADQPQAVLTGGEALPASGDIEGALRNLIQRYGSLENANLAHSKQAIQDLLDSLGSKWTGLRIDFGKFGKHQ